MGEGSDVAKAASLVGAVIGNEPERQGALLRMPSPDGSHLLTQMLRPLDDEGVQPDRRRAPRAVPGRRVPFSHRSRSRKEQSPENAGERETQGPAEQEGLMSAITATTGRLPVAKRSAIAKEFNDGRAMIGRNLIAYKRVPQLLVFSTIQPVIFVLMFTYVFGGAIKRAAAG